MIEIVTKHDIEDVFSNPREYIDGTSSLTLLKTHGFGRTASISISKDVRDDIYYITVADKNPLWKFVCTKGGLRETYNEALNRANGYVVH